jgi:hypothetical protein
MPEEKFISYLPLSRCSTSQVRPRWQLLRLALIAHMEITLEKSCVLNYTILKTNDFVLL